MKTFISPAEARKIVFTVAEPIVPERVRLSDALGRMVCEDVVTLDDLPPFDNSGMDGYAVRMMDLMDCPATLRVIEDIPAGTVPQGVFASGTCMRIMTGALVPTGTDAIVPVEWTHIQEPGYVTINRVPRLSAFIRRSGKDAKKGMVVVDKGTLLTPPAIGMIAAAGHQVVFASSVPCVAVITTGDELYTDPSPLPPGMIRDANGPALVAQVRHAGGRVLGPFLARDNRTHVRTVLSQVMEAADVLIISGGVSVGEYDFVKDVLDEAGMTLHFWRVRQRPGGPLAFGTLSGRLVFGLPGNPVSSFVCFEQYVRPALRRLMGQEDVSPNLFEACLEEPVPKKTGLHHFVRGVASRAPDGQLRVRHTGPQASNLYSSVAAANCLIYLPEPLEDPQTGHPVQIEWLSWAWPQ